MLQKMRDNAQGFFGKVVAGVIIVVLTMFGFGAFTAFVNNDPAAASVNGDDISRAELGREIERQRQRILNQMGEGADPDLIDVASLQGSVLESMINRTLLNQAADDMKLAVAESEVDRYFRENPQFQVAGQYDPALVRRVLNSVGHTPTSFRQDFKRSLRMAQLNGALTTTTLLTGWELRQLAALLSQTRDIAFLSFDPVDFEADVELDEHAVEDYYLANEADFMTTESIDVAYVSLTLAELLADESIEVSADAIQASYQESLEAFELIDERRASHILLEVNASRAEAETLELADSILRRIEQGEAFADLARELSEDPGSAESGGDLGFVSKGAFVPEFEAAMWALEIGTVSQPVRSEFGVHLILVTQARTPDYPEFDAVRDDLESTLRAEQAATLYTERVRRMDELAFEMSDGLDRLADQFGLSVATASGITRTEAEGPFANPRIRNAAFSDDVLDQGFNSAVVDLGDRATVVRLIERHLPELKPLAEVSDEISRVLIVREAQDRAIDAASAAYQALIEGAASSQVAAEHQREWVVLSNSRRQNPSVDPAITRAAFRLPRPIGTDRAVGSARSGSGVEVVVTVTAVRQGDYGALTEAERSGLRTQLSRSAGERDFGSLFQDLREAASIDRS
jgi:peptidyl-prolyl cis-trans isomerase D